MQHSPCVLRRAQHSWDRRCRVFVPLTGSVTVWVILPEAQRRRHEGYGTQTRHAHRKTEHSCAGAGHLNTPAADVRTDSIRIVPHLRSPKTPAAVERKQNRFISKRFASESVERARELEHGEEVEMQIRGQGSVERLGRVLLHPLDLEQQLSVHVLHPAERRTSVSRPVARVRNACNSRHSPMMMWMGQ